MEKVKLHSECWGLHLSRSATEEPSFLTQTIHDGLCENSKSDHAVEALYELNRRAVNLNLMWDGYYCVLLLLLLSPAITSVLVATHRKT